MPDPDLNLKFVDLAVMAHLTRGLTFDLTRCAEVLDDALLQLNTHTGLPDQITAWITAGTFDSGPCPSDPEGRIIVEITQSLCADGRYLYVAAILQKSNEMAAPVVFFEMHSPTLDIPMRVEVPLRALLLGNAPPAGTHTLYVHALLTDQGQEFVYYGITKRGWNLRFNEHMRAALAQKSKRLLANKLNELIEARAAQLCGVAEDRPKLAGLISSLCGVGLTREQAYESEEYLVDKFSLATKHANGLNMIPGGAEGIKQARHFLRSI